MKKMYVIVIVLVLAGIAIVAASNKKTQPADVMMKEPIPTFEALLETTPLITSTPEALMEESSIVKEVLVDANEFKFIPDTLTLKKGQKVKLILKNSGKMTHDWVVDELDLRTKVITGGTETSIEFTPTKTGTFEYYCSIGKHRENGMVGTLTVTE